ncbi:MAG: hypothetical protein OK474_11930 [Thaumarchaeota archaeon]|nr:hypothetical protein [Nitrososphaerota archaeon]
MSSGANGRLRYEGAIPLLIGIALVIASTLVLFPVGCNSPGFECIQQPSTFWTTFWPNFLVIDAGFVLLALGAFRAVGRALPHRIPIGFGLLLSGITLLLPSIGLGANVPVVMGSCPLNGCFPLTSSQFWSLYWYNYAALAVGLSLVLIGTGFVLFGVRKSPRVSNQLKGDTHPSARRPLRLRWFAIFFVAGTATLLFGEMIAPFPPPYVTYYTTGIVPPMFYASPFLFAISFLLAASSLSWGKDGLVSN